MTALRTRSRRIGEVEDLNPSAFKPYPLLMDPYFSPRPWGGTRLQEALGKTLPAAGGPYGEAWELSDHPDGRSRVANGPAAGRLFGDLLRRHPRPLLGVERAPARFPLLIKFIDAAENLSIQVHPGDDQARPLGERGKFEFWLIIDCRPGAEVVQGLQPGVGPDILRQAAQSGRVQPLLRRVAIRPGDLIAMPPGTVHALLAGTLVCEIQQASNLTYRLWDWNRRPARDLHIEQACAVVSYGAPPPPSPGSMDALAEGGWTPVFRNPFFEVHAARWSAARRSEQTMSNAHGVALSTIQGAGTLAIAGGEPQSLHPGQTWFVPAGLNDWRLAAGAEGLSLLLSRPLEIG